MSYITPEGDIIPSPKEYAAKSISIEEKHIQKVIRIILLKLFENKLGPEPIEGVDMSYLAPGINEMFSDFLKASSISTDKKVKEQLRYGSQLIDTLNELHEYFDEISETIQENIDNLSRAIKD